MSDSDSSTDYDRIDEIIEITAAAKHQQLLMRSCSKEQAFKIVTDCVVGWFHKASGIHGAVNIKSDRFQLI